MGSSRYLKKRFKVTGKNTSAHERSLIKFGYVKSQKPTRDARSCVIGTAEAGFNINILFFILTFMKELLTEQRIVFGIRVGVRLPEIGQIE